MSVLRRRLDEISLRPPGEHRERVQALSGACPHTIKYIEDDGGERSECMLYALEIPFELVNEVATFKCILDDFFIALPTLLEKISDSEVSAGLVILYFKDGKTKHVGRMCGNRVISKWGGKPCLRA